MAVTKRKRKANPYRAEVFVSGVRVASQSFETAAAAHAWHDKTKRRFESGRGPIGEKTLGEVIESYCEKALPSLATSTRRRWRMLLDFIAESPAKAVQMSQFDGRTVSELLDWLLAHRRARLSFRYSFTKELKMLKTVLGYFRDEYDETFLIPITRKHFKRARFRSRPPSRKDFFIPADKVGLWLAALAGRPDPIYRLVGLVQVVMGLRIGEATALSWDAIDFDRGLIHVKRTVDWVDEYGKSQREPDDRTKTPSSTRSLPFPMAVREALFAARELHPLSTVVFRNRKGEILSDETVRSNYRIAFEAVGLEWTGTHICRHTNATLGSISGRMEEIGINLGHTSERETRRYAKVHAMLKNSIPEKVADLIERGESGAPAQNHAQSDLEKKKTRGSGR